MSWRQNAREKYLTLKNPKYLALCIRLENNFSVLDVWAFIDLIYIRKFYSYTLSENLLKYLIMDHYFNVMC